MSSPTHTRAPCRVGTVTGLRRFGLKRLKSDRPADPWGKMPAAMGRATIVLACLVVLPLASRAGESRPADDWAETRARFASAMGQMTSGVAGALVTSKHRTEADQVRLAEAGYEPHPRSQHKLGLAWDIAAPAESLETLRDLARAQGFTALIMQSPVTGASYLHVQRFARSPLGTKKSTAIATDESATPASTEPAPVVAALPEPEPAIEPPRPMAGAKLDFPRRLLRKKVDGRIVLLLQVSEEGRVLDVAVDSSDLPEFEDFVANEVRRWSFHPPTREGRPVVATARLPIPIRLE